MRNVSDVAYLESSALVKLAIVEDESRALRGSLRGWRRHVSSTLAVVEVLRTVRRRDVERERTALTVLRDVGLIAIGNPVLASAAQLEPVALRSLDVIHLATALRLGDALAAFVSYDERQLEAAAALGLPVSSPR